MGFGDFLASVGSAISGGIGSAVGGLTNLVGGVADFAEAISPIALPVVSGIFGSGREFTPAPPQAVIPQVAAPFPSVLGAAGGQSILPARTVPTVGDVPADSALQTAGLGLLGAPVAVGAISGLLPQLSRLGGSLVRAAPAIAGGALAGEAIESLLTPSGGGAGIGGNAPFRMTQSGARAQMFTVANPVTGTLTTFRPAGRCILWSSDLSAAKRVKKVAGRARRGR